MRRLLILAVAVVALSGWNIVSASLILENAAPFDLSGTGLGAVNTIMTMQATGNATIESGCVGLTSSGTKAIGPTGCVDATYTGVDTKTGASQSRVETLDFYGISSGSQLRLVFNPAEPGSKNTIDLTALTLTLFNDTGAVVFNSGVQNFGILPLLSTGTGRSGYFFKLDSQQASDFDAAIAANQTLFVGLEANATNAAGGQETFFLTAVPEPATFALAGGVLLLAGLFSRLRRGRC